MLPIPRQQKTHILNLIWLPLQAKMILENMSFQPQLHLSSFVNITKTIDPITMISKESTLT